MNNQIQCSSSSFDLDFSWTCPWHVAIFACLVAHGVEAHFFFKLEKCVLSQANEINLASGEVIVAPEFYKEGTWHDYSVILFLLR